MANKKIMIVDDSVFMRKLCSDIIRRDKDLEIVGVAVNGLEAIEKNKSLKPDAILLDVELPIINGIKALEKIMEERPCAVVMFSSLTKEGAETTLKAMQLGACDFIAKPSGSYFSLEEVTINEILNKLKQAKYIPERKKKISYREHVYVKPNFVSDKIKKLVAIGISTGGPKALEEVLEEFPANIDFPILIVQHMPKLFTKAFANRLNEACAITVKEAEDGEVLKAGIAYIAKGDYQMRLYAKDGYIKLSVSEDEKVSGHRPSADVLFESVSKVKNLDKVVAVIMTGMGRDGAEGILKLKEAGATTIAQDEASSVVYGMPRSAVELGAIDKVSPLSKIATEIIRSMGV